VKEIKGAFSAIITPYSQNGEIDTGSLGSIVAYQLSEGLAGFFVAGTTGEGLLLDTDERCRVTDAVVESTGDKGVVIIHVGAMALRDVLKLAKHAESAGADAIAAIPPIYFRSSSENVVNYYREIAGVTELPVYGYHIPSLTGVSLYREIMEGLKDVPNIAGMKYTDSNLDEMQYMLVNMEPGLNILYGRDQMLVAGLLMGAKGGIGSTYNIMPRVYADICNLAEQGEWGKARQLQFAANRVIDVLVGFGVMPALKVILEDAGFQTGNCRKPVEPLKGTRSELFEALKRAGYYDLPGVVTRDG